MKINVLTSLKIKPVIVTAAIAILGAAAAYPHIDAYVKSLPVKMTKEQAGKRYLQVTCPSNTIGDQGNKVLNKIEEESKKLYYPGSKELAQANARVGALNNNYISLGYRYRDSLVKQSKELTNPKFIWPDEVKKDITYLADDAFNHAGAIDNHFKGKEKFKSNDSLAEKKAEATSRVRRILNLPLRGVCPSEYNK